MIIIHSCTVFSKIFHLKLIGKVVLMVRRFHGKIGFMLVETLSPATQAQAQSYARKLEIFKFDQRMKNP